MSACLLGQPVRFDGGHKRDDFVVGVIGANARFVPVCPEVELGLGTPRDTLRLVKHEEGIRLIMADGADHTARMREYSVSKVAALEAEDLDGYVLKARSPSCGISSVAVFESGGLLSPTGRGLFAAALLDRFPDLPVVEETDLKDPGAQAHFIDRVLAYRNVKALFRSDWSFDRLLEFHVSYKLALLAHSEKSLPVLGRLVANSRRVPVDDVRRRYVSAFMAAFNAIPTIATHTNALQHAAGHLRGRLGITLRNGVSGMIQRYGAGEIALDAPKALIRDYALTLHVDYLTRQIYLQR